MKKNVKKGIIIGGSIVSIIIVLVLVLSLIPIRPIKSLDGYTRITLLDSYNQPVEERDETKKVLEDSFKDIKFSVMRAILEGDLNYAVKAVTTKDEDDKTVKKTLTVSQLKEVRSDEDGYLLMLSYDTARTSKDFTDDDGNKVLFDRVLITIPKGNGNIQTITMYPYLLASTLSDKGNDIPDADGVVDARFYVSYVYTAKAYTSGFYYDLKDVLDTLY